MIRRTDGLVLGAGALLLASPLFWPPVTGPVVLLADPVGAALGFGRPGGTLLLVGASYLAVGLAGVATARSGRPAVEAFGAGAVGALVLAWLVAWDAFAPSFSVAEAVGARLTSYVFALWPIALGAVAGAAEGWRRRGVVLVVAAVAVVQFGAVLLSSVWPLRPGTLPGFVALGLTIVVPVYVLVFAYPLYRYGRRFRPDG